MPTPMQFEGHTALVTGGSLGIGKAICQALLERGATVIDVDIREPDYRHPRLEWRRVDLAEPEEVRGLAADVRREGRVGILVNNAGVVRNTRLPDVCDEEFDLMVNLHLRTAICLTQACVAGMQERRFGRIVNLASRAIVGLAGRTVYGATKAALVAMTRTWALEFGPDGITVNAISPGPVATPMLRKDIPEDSEAEQRLAQALPCRRLGNADDVARAAVFFAAPESDWITGQNLFVCGGASIGASVPL
ncbi:3-oxoacyl-[acyl-carrier-protein] reductase FabG [compost metagenome]